MRHHFLDHYWTIDSPIHRLDPRLKIVASLVALVAVVVTPNGRFVDYAFFAPLILILLAMSKLPITAIIKRMLVILPITAIIALSLPFVSPGKPVFAFKLLTPLTITDAGLKIFASVIIKATFAIWIMTLLTATTSFRDLLAGMQSLKIPRIFTSIMGFMYRYIFLLIDEVEHMNIGRRSRSFGKRPVLAVKGFAWMISSLMIRSFERGERIYQAMYARGFNGTFKTMTVMHAGTKEIAACASFIVLIVIIKLIGYFH